jgi:hypothetical protein
LTKFISQILIKNVKTEKNRGLAVGELKGTIGQVRGSSLYTALQSDHSQSSSGSGQALDSEQADG